METAPITTMKTSEALLSDHRGQLHSGSGTVNMGETEVFPPRNGTKVMVALHIPFYSTMGSETAGSTTTAPHTSPAFTAHSLKDNHFIQGIGVCHREGAKAIGNCRCFAALDAIPGKLILVEWTELNGPRVLQLGQHALKLTKVPQDPPNAWSSRSCGLGFRWEQISPSNGVRSTRRTTLGNDILLAILSMGCRSDGKRRGALQRKAEDSGHRTFCPPLCPRS